MSATRRTLLAGIALPSILSTASAAVRVPTSQDDSALAGLGQELEKAQRLRNAAYDRMVDAEMRAVYPSEPEVLIATNWDLGNGMPMPAYGHGVRGRTWSPGQIEEIRSRIPRREDTISARRRAEILAAYDTHAAAVRAEDEALDIPGLEAAFEAARKRRDDIAARIIETPALSTAGLVVKARALVVIYGKVPEVKVGDPTSGNAFRSIVADLLAMGGAA